MDTQNPSLPPHAQSRISGKNHPPRRASTAAHSGGVVHDNTRHTTRFTVIGNHLAQHPDLSGLAIGLAVHIQSLPAGARVDIKTLAARFPEGTTRIAAALRELETHGYLRRPRERTESGRIVTRTVSCNQPGRRDTPADTSNRPTRRPAQDKPPPRRKLLPAVPQPSYTSPTLLQAAIDLLAGLRRADPRLLLSATDAEHLAPGVAAWLERDLTPTAVRHALTSDLPAEPLYRPAALLAHRLTAQLPPLPPYRAPEQPPPVRHPLHNCDTCDRAFRGPEPGSCRACASVGGIAEIPGTAGAAPAR
ncbi:helix-turn-helix domain-containing protein [Streptomyces sp. NPDC060002]|uniref:helix-turn-helix domain-containing protein n=1 Tax=Streptomyces sp. NPDC060002 TaxID=3347033 RepID=UPI0036AC63FB